MKLLPANKAAEYFGIHTNTLRLWASKGIIKTVPVGSKQHRYDIESVGNLNEITENEDGETSV